jgi:hypothetical protein
MKNLGNSFYSVYGALERLIHGGKYETNQISTLSVLTILSLGKLKEVGDVFFLLQFYFFFPMHCPSYPRTLK